MKRTHVAVLGAILIVCVFALTLLLQPAARTLQQATANAVHYCENLQEPDALLMLDLMHRRFGIEVFANSLQRYDQILAQLPLEQAPHLRVFRRIADPYNPILEEDWQAISTDIDFFIVPALYCDRQKLPDNYPDTLNRAANEGGLKLTHTLLACIWIQESGREEVLPEGFLGNVYRATAALIDSDSVVNEIELEAAAFLYLAGQGALVNETFVERVIAVQNDDGGWPRSSGVRGNSYWHSTVLGLFVLLHAKSPASSYTPMLPYVS